MSKILTILFLLVQFSCIGQTRVHGYLTTDSLHWLVRPAKIAAYISTPATTTTTDAGTYYFLKSTFTNVNTVSFGFVGDTLQYQNGSGYVLQGAYSFTFSANEPNCTVTISISINDVVCPLSTTSALMKTAGEYYDIHGLIFCKANNNDKIKILIKSDKAGAIITPIQGSTFLYQLQ